MHTRVSSLAPNSAAALAARADGPGGSRFGFVSPRKAQWYCLISRSDPIPPIRWTNTPGGISLGATR